MKSRKLGGIIIGTATLIVIGYTIFKIITGKALPGFENPSG